MILSIFGIVCGIAALGYSVKVALVFQRFNDGIKAWSEEIDNTTNAAINRAARNILRELDEKISAQKEENDVEPLNENENEQNESC